MDRGKNLPPKGSKVKPIGFAGDFIALGPKQGRAELADVKKPSPTTAGPSKSSPSPIPTGSVDKKRDTPPTQLTGSSQVPPKKAKPGLQSSGAFAALGRPSLKTIDPPSPGSNSSRLEPWEDVAVEVEPTELLSAISEAESNDDEEKIEALLCGAVKQMKFSSIAQRNKVEPILALALVYLGKCRPQYFNTEHVVEALLALLRRDNLNSFGAFKGRPSAGAASLACNLILAGCQDEKNWPESFLKIFIDDSVGERFWVDRDECQGFVENILTAFSTKMPPRNLLQTESAPNAGTGGSSSGAASSPSVTSMSAFGLDDDASNLDSDSSQGGMLRGINLEHQQVQVIPRFQEIKDLAETLVMDVVNQHFGRRQQPPSDLATRNFLKFLTSTAGLPAVRLQAAQRLEIWLSNQKLLRPATDLLLSICLNCKSEIQSDSDTINALLRLRLKTKPLLQSYLCCFKEMVEQQPEQLPLIIRLLIFNELSPSRGPNNMAVLAVLVQPWPDRAATILADVFMELLLNRDDYLRALRALLREIIRALRQDLPLPTFCAALLQGTTHDRRRAIIREFEFKDRLLSSLADLATLCIFLAISPTIRESAALISRIDLREMEVFRQFQVQASTIQREAINWLRAAVPSVFEANRADYIHCLRKILFVESSEHYYNKDGWPPEVDRQVMIRLAAEIPVAEETFIQVLVIGLSREHPLAAPDALDLADQLLRRCAAVHNQGFLMLEADNREIFDMVLRLTAYHYPENIVLPQGYTPPSLAISALYWRAWMMLLMLTAHNPASLGAEAWNHYPILRSLMEMCITNDFSSLNTLSDPQELQVTAIEKQQILEFETHLAAASTKAIITESNSLLLSQLTTLDPRGPVRRPPPGVLDQLRSLNATLKLGHLLCRSRMPDFLLEILHRQGATQSKPWLAELVESNEGSWNVLPVQCLCEFLLHESIDEIVSAEIAEDGKQQLGKRKERRLKHQQLVQHIKQLLMDPNQPLGACREVLDYLMRRLSAKKAHGRSQALNALSAVLSLREDETSMNDSLLFDAEESQFTWLVQHLPSIPHFQHVKSGAIFALRGALQVETNPSAVAAYFRFLAKCALDEPLAYLGELCFDVGTVLIERSSLINALLPSSTNQSPTSFRTLEHLLQLFLHYLLRARERNKDAYTWSEDQQLLLVQWQTGESASLHVYVIHAMVILLTYGEPKIEQHSCFPQLLDIWFPSSEEPPQAYLVDTSEEALLYPDWLKLRMIRSSVLALVDAALKDLEPKELILFIQSFGIPVASMTKLLHALDQMVQQNAFAFVEVDMDKAYMQQLLQVQWARGAQGGLQFADIMQMGEPEQGHCTDLKNINQPIRPPLDLSLLPSKQAQAPTEMNVELASHILRQLFDFKTVIRLSQPEKIKAYRNLSNAISLEASSFSLTTTEAITIALDTLLASTSASKADFDILMSAIERQPAFSCGILRLLTASAATPKGSRLMPIILTICQKIAPSETEGSMSSLKSIALQFIKQHGGARPNSTPIDTSTLDLASKRLERQMQQMASRSLEAGDTRSLICEIETNLSRNRTRTNYFGLLVDWLELLDPEIIKAQPEIETRLLFGRTPNPPLCRPYVTTLLVHQASWDTLRKCTHQVLDPERDQYEPKVVLDFLAALVKVPKLWQGRDKHVPKHYEPEDLLLLNRQQLFRLSEYIMGEFSQLFEKDKSKALGMLGERTKLLLQCCGGSSKMEVRLARDVANAAFNSKTESRQKAAQQLLLQIYAYAPHVITHLPKNLPPLSQTDENKILLNSVPCALDSMAVALISAITTTQPGKDGARKMADLEIALRKMAATHPDLLLRHFTSLASSLRGRSHYDLPYLRSGNHFNLFACTLGLIQQLGPKLFVPDHRKALEDMLSSYWSLFNYQKGAKDFMGPLLQKFMQFLREYIAYAPATAFHVLQYHAPLLQDLQMVHPDMVAIKELLSALSRPRPNDSEEHNQPTWIPYRPTIRLGPILTRLRQSDNHEEVILVLQDLENICGRMACAPLEGALADLRPLMCSPNQIIRNTTFALLLRYLKDNPNASSDLLPDYIDCLENSNAAVVTTALERLPDFLILCQEYGDVLLQKTYTLAVENGFNTQSNLSEAVMLLQQQAGM